MPIAQFPAAGLKRLRLAMLGVLLAWAALCACAGGVLAHASLVTVEPADGSTVGTAPRSFSLAFNEPVSPLVLTLVRPDGSSMALDRFTLRDTVLDIEAPGGLGNGTYVLSWRVVSEDGHPVGGSAVFSIGSPSGSGMPAAVEAADRPVRVAIWTAKIALYIGLFMGVGGAFFVTWIGGRSRFAARIAEWTMGAALLAVPLSVGFQGLDALGLPLSGLAQKAAWAAGFSTSYGTTALIAAAALAGGLVSLRLRGAGARALSLAALIAIGLALAASGHASAAHPQWLTRPAVFLHALGIAFWAGSLVPLGTALARRAPDAARILARFSRAIPLAVLPLAAAGVLLAIVQLRTPDALWSTAYGRVLLAKLILLAALLALAAVNRLWLTQPVLAGEQKATRRLGRSIRIEIVLIAAIFAVAALWRFTPPPRALAETAAVPAFVHIHTGKAMAEVTVTPGRAGPASASIMIMDGDFQPLEAKEVTLVLSNPAAGIEPIRRPAARTGDGAWQVADLNLPLAGKWSVRVDILVSDFELTKLEGTIDIRR